MPESGPHPRWRVVDVAPLGGHHAGYAREDATCRQRLAYVSTAAPFRLRFANPHRSTGYRIEHASVGRLRDSAAVEDLIEVTVGGRTSFEVPPSGWVHTDPLAWPSKAGPPSGYDALVVSTYSPSPLPFLSHAMGGAVCASTAEGTGDLTDATDDTAFTTVSAMRTWIDAVEVCDRGPATVLVIGDSITDAAPGLDGPTRWTELVATGDDRPLVLSVALAGNTLGSVANQVAGENALNRIERDVLGHHGIGEILVFEGTNDLLVGCSAEHVRYSLERLAAHGRDAGLRTAVATVIPRGLADFWTPAHETERGRLNDWIRRQSVFDDVVDFDAAVRDDARPDRIRAELTVDRCHPNAAGARALAAAYDAHVAVRRKHPPERPVAGAAPASSPVADLSAGSLAGVEVQSVEFPLTHELAAMSGRGCWRVEVRGGGGTITLPVGELGPQAKPGLAIWLRAEGRASIEARLAIDDEARTLGPSVTIPAHRWQRAALVPPSGAHYDHIVVELSSRAGGAVLCDDLGWGTVDDPTDCDEAAG